jgi:hypothetical protein
VLKHVNAAADGVVAVEGNLVRDVAEADVLDNGDDLQKSSDVLAVRQDDGGQFLEADLFFHQEIVQSALIAGRTFEALQRKVGDVRAREIPDHVNDNEGVPARR